ncbi:YajG family lipoprotein [Chromatiaceae bacterium AAb-1]|nr:YajG family lipoprotein [Chromatiaceae bacterium AAb-1]
MRYLILVAFLLGGCASKVPSFIVAPQVFWPQSAQLQQSQFAFYLTDNRPQNYTLRIQQGDKTEQYPTTNNLRQQLEQTLAQALTDKGATLTSGSDNVLTIQIDQLDALIHQRTLDHQVNNKVTLTLLIQNQAGSFRKSYSGDSSFTSPFKADIAAVERELRVLTEQVVSQLLQDDSWQNYLRG